MPTGEGLLQVSAGLHHRLCPRQMLGMRMGLLASTAGNAGKSITLTQLGLKDALASTRCETVARASLCPGGGHGDGAPTEFRSAN